MSGRDWLERIPPTGGTYALYLHLSRARRIGIGRLGEYCFGAGSYIYVGSAFGAGGLRGRVRHHLAAAPRPRWHVDYLRAYASLRAVAFTTDERKHECQWVSTLLALPGASSPVPRFGASDCRAGCAAHLIRLAGSEWVEALRVHAHKTGRPSRPPSRS